MNGWKCATVLAAVLACASCASNTATFVTSSSLGINFDTTPATASIAYDRTEGYAAPLDRNGVLPPVIASIETSRSILNPKIKQLYATGKAAVIVAGGSTDGASTLVSGARQSFAGTTTTFGLKLSFTTGAPESLNLGYKRKEFSFIPLECKAPDARGDAECDRFLNASTIASYDTTVSTTTLATTGLTTRQFIATGLAAEALAGNQRVKDVFQKESANAIAEAAGQQDAVDQDERIRAVLAVVAPDGTLNATALGKLVAKANGRSCVIPTGVAASTTAGQLQDRLDALQPAAKCLFEAM